MATHEPTSGKSPPFNKGTASAKVHGNPKDSMKSTWRREDRSRWSIFHWIFEVLDIHPTHLDKAIPVHRKDVKVPHMAEWSLHRWIILHAAVPIILQQAYITWSGNNFTTLQALLLYSLTFNLSGIHELHIFRRQGHEMGFLDGDVHERDGVPDSGVRKVIISLFSTSSIRSILIIFLAYNVDHAPKDAHWYWLPVETGAYLVVLDFWFYWYHRLMHEVPVLWKYHRTHHLTKHPNALLTLYADSEQEFFDILGIPLLTYLSLKGIGLPMGFYEWWICHQYITFTELAGHSGLRLHSYTPTILSPLLRWSRCELIIEDHDLHHRKGWKSSGNYGKQTRIWDRAFGTCKDRIECVEDNIDWENSVVMPLF
ncbi:hypothetical protein QQS21_010340 [Conoideocrella luteorostrata]|uniref:Fatty acid hydroxylase domain-containing protein n=1 Tax=Conoideocrella luteorostrata TaxID=1105319 RepID=A0AAJ0CF83_9HYPO|nr:hypothetical protein QQS21_010340 [Conoideocrella luteorostrata]